jgi:hypothetical protein
MVLLKELTSFFPFYFILLVLKGMCFVLRYCCIISIILYLTREARNTTLLHSKVYLHQSTYLFMKSLDTITIQPFRVTRAYYGRFVYCQQKNTFVQHTFDTFAFLLYCIKHTALSPV